MIEKHPFGNFVAPNAKYLILGSFPARESGDWFYSSKRNQFWPILEKVYRVELKDKKSKQALFTKLKIAVADIIFKCDRVNGSSLDFNLVDIVYNIGGIERILKGHKIQKIFFTSRFVEIGFRKIIGEPVGVQLVTLPSPSPRYAAMTIKEKVSRYKKTLPAFASF